MSLCLSTTNRVSLVTGMVRTVRQYGVHVAFEFRILSLKAYSQLLPLPSPLGSHRCRAATGALLNIDHTLTKWPNIDRFLFSPTDLASSKKIFANSIEKKTSGVLQSIVN